MVGQSGDVHILFPAWGSLCTHGSLAVVAAALRVLVCENQQES